MYIIRFLISYTGGPRYSRSWYPRFQRFRIVKWSKTADNEGKIVYLFIIRPNMLDLVFTGYECLRNCQIVKLSNCQVSYNYLLIISEATSEVVEGDYGGQTNRLVYAVFTTPRNAIGGNAICAFRIRDIMDAFEGAFKEQVSI